MGKEKNKGTTTGKERLSHEKIYSIMQWYPIVVAGIFFLINVFKGNTNAAIAVGLCLAAFCGIVIIVKVRKVPQYQKELIQAISMPFLVFMISQFSGQYYSDDFPLYLAIIALTGMYLEPQFTKIQIVIIDILLVIMYIRHPEKVESQSQFIMCYAIFTLAAFLFYQVIKRGRTFIEISAERAAESEKLLSTIRSMGNELQHDFADSSEEIDQGIHGLQGSSISIARGTEEVVDDCTLVQSKLREAEAQVAELNKEVMQFEDVLVENSGNMNTMNEQFNAVSAVIGEAGEVMRAMSEQMSEIGSIAKQINDISFQLTILALNASVEAAHAGEYGSGFEVVANEIKTLSENSTAFSNRVADVVKDLLSSAEKTTERFADSETVLKQSEKTMGELTTSFGKLNQQFAMLYDNIECQNTNITQMDNIFSSLNQSVSDMNSSSKENKKAVDAISHAMEAYKNSVDRIVENTRMI